MSLYCCIRKLTTIVSFTVCHEFHCGICREIWEMVPYGIPSVDAKQQKSWNTISMVFVSFDLADVCSHDTANTPSGRVRKKIFA